MIDDQYPDTIADSEDQRPAKPTPGTPLVPPTEPYRSRSVAVP